MRSFARSALKLVAAATLLFAGSAMFVPQGPARADDIDDAIAAMKEAAKAKDSGKCIAKMVELEERLDDRVGKAFADLTKNKDVKIAAAAIRQLGKRKDKGFSKKVTSKLGDKKLFKMDDDTLPKAYLDAAAMYANPKNQKALVKLVKKYLSMNSVYSTRSIKAYGSVREKETVDQLIEWLIQTESTGQSQGGKNLSQETRDNYAQAKSAVIQTLADLTLQEIGDGKTWKEFWEKRKKKFVFPDPNAADIDPTTLAEWSDQAYGYTIKKPEGETWTFCDSGTDFVRMRLESRDPKDELVMCRADFMIHNMSTGAPTSVGDMAKWYVAQFKAERFSALSKDPLVEEKKIAGREFTVISARGDSGSYHSGWGTIELRIYLTKVGHICLRMEALTRLGASDEEQAGLWKAIEESTWIEE